MASEKRSPVLPNVPTLAEAGVKGAAFQQKESARWKTVIDTGKITAD